MEKNEIIDKYIQRIMIDYPEADKIHIDLVQFAEEMRQCNVSGALPPVPGWIVKYDQANHQSSAGKAIRLLMQRIEKLESLQTMA